eukprot:TRINITY_DN14269_c0_g1_i2.p2 TRINITY_DN14269_c0_g1~~TRINITY_DN14269_c0_g1_i2.p2  ORF type:complete len:110 (+),score=23.20 TRINITY_DN14269_c0_g1_i2:81-410(+)
MMAAADSGCVDRIAASSCEQAKAAGVCGTPVGKAQCPRSCGACPQPHAGAAALIARPHQGQRRYVVLHPAAEQHIHRVLTLPRAAPAAAPAAAAVSAAPLPLIPSAVKR